MIPKDFNVAKESTASLIELHQTLDAAIAGKRGATLSADMSLQTAKRHKCDIKTALAVRAKQGDVDALQYAQKRKWPLTPSLAVAAE